MAEIIEGGGGHEKGGKKRPKKSPVRMDMTPMVDLAFLLLTFFILATSLSKPKTLEIVYPKEVENKDDQTKLDDDLATTIVIGETDDQIVVFLPEKSVLCAAGQSNYYYFIFVCCIYIFFLIYLLSLTL